MRETITVNRIIQCSYTKKEVAQQISAYYLSEQGKSDSSEILTKYCSGYSACGNADCQFLIGLAGKVYTKSLESIFVNSNK